MAPFDPYHPITSPNRMQRDAVAAVLRSTPHRCRTNEKLIREAMEVHVVYTAKPFWT